MATNITPINEYSPSFNDTFLFDNNIWIYLLCPLSNFDQRQQSIYSDFLRNVLLAKSTIYVTSLILSEFVNRCLRFDYNQWKKYPENIQYGLDYKTNFIGSDAYRESVKNVTNNVNRIISLTEKFPDDFHIIDLNFVLRNLNHVDFNDSYFIQMAKKRDLKIVTHDADFFNPQFDISIITGNKNIPDNL